MNLLAKMMTALRGGVTEAGEAMVDSQALRILDQEIRDASEELNESRNALAEIMARQKLSAQKAKQLEDKVAEHEGYALKALEQGDEALAGEVAEKIAEFENQVTVEKDAAAGFDESVTRMREAINQAEHNIRHLKQQVDTVKAVDNVQRAQVAVAERFSGSNSKLGTAMDSLDRIKEKHELQSARMAAAKELADETPASSLQQKLEKAGIAPSSKQASDVLERLKKKRG